MKAHPILFSGPMVRAILDGRKTQTRRVVKPQPREVVFGYNVAPHTVFYDGNSEAIQRHYCCPYGQPGDLLWVRETWYQMGKFAPMGYEGEELEDYQWCGTWKVLYVADNPDVPPRSGDVLWRKRPSIHMPRWASRLTLRITDVRVERVRDISTEDQIAEGLSTRLREHDAVCDLRDQWARLWDSINAKRGYSWESNPWVWVIGFEAIQRNVEDVLREEDA